MIAIVLLIVIEPLLGIFGSVISPLLSFLSIDGFIEDGNFNAIAFLIVNPGPLPPFHL